MESTVTPVSSGMEVHAHVKIVVVYGRQADGEWKVARLLELLD
jgi:ketosteroid isomerase-like protein